MKRFLDNLGFSVMLRTLDPFSLGVGGHESEIIELALTHGFEALEIDMADFASRADHHGIVYARRLLESAQIRVGAFCLPFDWDTEDEAFRQNLDRLNHYAELAVQLGCTRCYGIIAPAGDKRPYHENFELHRVRFAEICKVLAPHGVKFGVGFRASGELRKSQAFLFIHDFDALALLVKMVDAPNLGFVVDPWNWELAGISIKELQGLHAEKIVNVQLADMPSPRPEREEITEQMRLLPGSGGIDLVAYLRTLREMAYDGPVSLAPHRKALPVVRRETLVRQSAEAFQRIWREAGLEWRAPIVPSLTR